MPKAYTATPLSEEAARIMCEQGLVDYRAAKQKAATRLGLGAHQALPSNREVRDAVLAYQRLFGGEEYRARLRSMRETALKAMSLLSEFRPRLVGAAVDGALHHGHNAQLHVFSDAPEMLDFLFEDRKIAYETDERSYRIGKSQTREYPMIRFLAGPVAVDLTIFPEKGIRQAPMSPVDGAPMKRLDAAAVQRLIDADAD